MAFPYYKDIMVMCRKADGFSRLEDMVVKSQKSRWLFVVGVHDGKGLYSLDRH